MNILDAMKIVKNGGRIIRKNIVNPGNRHISLNTSTGDILVWSGRTFRHPVNFTVEDILADDWVEVV